MGGGAAEKRGLLSFFCFGFFWWMFCSRIYIAGGGTDALRRRDVIPGPPPFWIGFRFWSMATKKMIKWCHDVMTKCLKVGTMAVGCRVMAFEGPPSPHPPIPFPNQFHCDYWGFSFLPLCQLGGSLSMCRWPLRPKTIHNTVHTPTHPPTPTFLIYSLVHHWNPLLQWTWIQSPRRKDNLGGTTWQARCQIAYKQNLFHIFF